MSGLDKLKEQLKENQVQLQQPASMDKVKTICELLKDRIKEIKQRQSIEDRYKEVTRQIYLKLEELEPLIEQIEQHKTSSNVAEYNKKYSELLSLAEEQNELDKQIDKEQPPVENLLLTISKIQYNNLLQRVYKGEQYIQEHQKNWNEKQKDYYYNEYQKLVEELGILSNEIVAEQPGTTNDELLKGFKIK